MMLNLLNHLPKRPAAATLIGLGVLLAPAQAFACNPIEALFGACQLEVFRPAYIPRDFEPRLQAPRRKIDHARQARKPTEAVARKAVPLEATSEAPQGSLALFRRDPTLRTGDIVVTNEGFKVFRAGDFRAIAHNDGKLAELEKASMIGRSPRAPKASVAGRQAAAHRERVTFA